MLLSITTTHRPAADLGFLLHKHPDKVQSFDLSFGRAHAYYPEVTADRCTACLLLEVDAVGPEPSAGCGGRARVADPDSPRCGRDAGSGDRHGLGGGGGRHRAGAPGILCDDRVCIAGVRSHAQVAERLHERRLR